MSYDLSEVMDYPLWYARYDVDAPSFYYDFAMWQYSSKGSVDGIKGQRRYGHLVHQVKKQKKRRWPCGHRLFVAIFLRARSAHTLSNRSRAGGGLHGVDAVETLDALNEVVAARIVGRVDEVEARPGRWRWGQGRQECRYLSYTGPPPRRSSRSRRTCSSSR